MLNTLWVIMCYSGRKDMQKLAEQHKKDATVKSSSGVLLIDVSFLGRKKILTSVPLKVDLGIVHPRATSSPFAVPDQPCLDDGKLEVKHK